MPDPKKFTLPRLPTLIAGVVMLALGGVAFWFTHAAVLPDWVRWGVTIPWLAYTGFMIVWEMVLGRGDNSTKDSIALDRWTIAHGWAGLVFGVWYMPLAVVVGLTLLWEVYEWKFPGVGDTETLINRAVDVGIALVLWAVVVVPTVLIASAPFPLLLPHRP